jgi:tRNA-splicing ligase RtcB (3'-phosphate/5'-hydroxy nucleic acid ligase)
MRRFFINLPDADLAYLPEGTPNFTDYWEAVDWAQRFATENRKVMMRHAVDAMRGRSTRIWRR